MSKTVWVVYQYASTPETGIGGRHYYLGRELAKMGYKVYLISANSHHLLRNKPELIKKYEIEVIDKGFKFVWVKMPDYTEAHSKQRVMNWFLFPWRIQKLAGAIPDKPDAILSSSPSVVAFLGARHLARKFKAKLIFEVRDIWPLTLTEIGGYSPRHPFIRFMQWVEDKAYRDSDAVVSNLKNSIEHMVGRGMQACKFSWIPNGISIDEVSLKSPLSADIKSKLPSGKFTVGYTGTHGVANALNVLVDAAERLRDYPDIVFVLVGGGKEKATLRRRVKERGLSNLIFIDPIPKAQIQSMLSEFDACYIGWLNDDLYRFGIGANKIPDYLYSGKPIIHSYSGACDPVMEAQAGIQIPAEDPEQLAEAVIRLYEMSEEERWSMGENGRKAALELYEYEKLAEQLATILFK
ncbi:glycosyltransferase family 4 protein [Alloalcanivorax xenomutans]|uniref:glycosyltransferase family 4 protein n=1 Tax=Alloalcanivorax xenomutans TaxID=1094342 RepID=UPI0024E1B585|nr:glycosyltransferase family 4 protein [Alloalcanivorax xenomutans]